MRAVARPDSELPIAVFDSGVGGLTVLHECLVSLPHEDFVYLGDTARFPYGDRSRGRAARVRARAGRAAAGGRGQAARGGLQLGHRRGAAGAARGARRPGAGGRRRRARVAARGGGHAQRAGRAAGHAGHRRQRRLRARARRGGARTPSCTPVASAELAPLIQAGGEVDERVVDCVERACAPLKEAGVDTVILGCTHYPLVRPVLQRSLGRGVTIVSSGQAIADEVEHALDARRPRGRPGRAGAPTASSPPATTDDFRRLGIRFLQLPIDEVRHVEVAEPRAAERGMSARTTAARRATCARSRSSPGFVRTASGSALIEAGGTRVICTASVDEDVPRWMAGKGRGWVTAEYGMLPASTGERKAARRLARARRRAHRGDPAADRALAARRDRLRGARRAHGLDRLRRARGRRRHPLRRDHRRLRGARAGAARPGRARACSSACRSRSRWRRSRAAWSTAWRCSTSTTARTAPPRSTRTWS